MARSFFENRVAVITGSSRGIGRATAYALAEAGASVVLNGRNTGRLEETRKKMAAEGHTVIAVPGDITSPEESRNLIEKAYSVIDPALGGNCANFDPPESQLLLCGKYYS